MFFNMFIWGNINPGTTGIGSGLPPSPGGGYYGGIGPAGTGNNNNCNPSGPSGHTPTFITTFEFPSDPSIDLGKMFKCLDNLSSTGATYSISLMTQLPNESDPDDFIWGKSGGHTFINITKVNGSTTVKQSFGMYPGTSALFGGGTAGVDNRFVDDGSEDVDGRMIMSITHAQYLTIKAEALSWVDGVYDMNDQNCVDFALSVFNSVRGSDPIEVESCWTGGIQYKSMPAKVYKRLDQMKTNGHAEAGNITIALTGMVSPVSAGECN